MRIFEQVEDSLVRWQYAQMTKRLKTTPPDEFARMSELSAVNAFKRAARSLPGYGRLLSERGVNPKSINSIEDFQTHVPILDKRTVFNNPPLADFCQGGSLRGIDYFWSSSGQSGAFSFAADTRRNTKKAALGVEFLLNNLFDTNHRKTLLINCTPMGVRIPTRTIPVADTSVRSDVALALVKKLGPEFDQILLIGESLFLKKLLEEGQDQGVGWGQRTVHVITGGEFVPETYRSYLMSILEIEKQGAENGIVAINMGLSELATSIFSDNLDTIRLRQTMQNNTDLRHAIVGPDRDAIPEILQFFPMSTFVETVQGTEEESELAVTLLDRSAVIPLVRYNTGDLGKIISYEQLEKELDARNLGELRPQFHLPVAIIWGRKPKTTPGDKNAIHPNRIKELLYANHTICAKLTGNFRIEDNHETPEVLFQMRPHVRPEKSVAGQLQSMLEESIVTDIVCRLFAHREFPWGIELNYEKKMQYC